MIIPKDKKILIMLFLMTIIISIIGIFVLYPTITQIRDINQETTNIKRYLETKHQNTISIRQSREKSENIKETVASYLNYIFYTGEELKLITTLEEVAKKTNVEQNIKNYKLENNKIILNTTINGDYLSILEYIRGIESVNYFINIDDLTMSLSTTKEHTDLITAELTLSLYAQ